jgi:hypothetical protein
MFPVQRAVKFFYLNVLAIRRIQDIRKVGRGNKSRAVGFELLMRTARENHHVQDLERIPDFSLTEGTELAGQPL